MEKKEQPSYSPAFQAEAVKLVLEQGLSIQVAAKRLNLPKSTLGRWGQKGEAWQAACDAWGAFCCRVGSRGREAEGRVGRSAERYAHMMTLRLEFPITALCRALSVSRSGFYA